MGDHEIIGISIIVALKFFGQITNNMDLIYIKEKEFVMKYQLTLKFHLMLWFGRLVRMFRPN